MSRKKILKTVEVLGISYVPERIETGQSREFDEHSEKYSVKPYKRTINDETVILYLLDGELNTRNMPGKWSLEQVTKWVVEEGWD